MRAVLSVKLGIAIVVAGALVSACTAPRRAPVVERAPPPKPAAVLVPAPAAKPPLPAEERPQFHTVKKGETLYSIALEYGLDYRELADWNSIDPTRIQVGQQLRLTPPGAAVSAAPLKSAPEAIEARPLGAPPGAAPAAPLPAPGLVKSEPKGVRLPYSEQAYAQLATGKPEAAPAAKPEAAAPAIRPESTPPAVKPEARPEPKPDAAPPDAAGLGWMWPASGKLVGSFNGSTAKGIVIAGKLGQPVVASAAGKVIHSGTGIRGLGKFIVIKHNDAYLSVYAHNSQLLVKEGDSVTRGQKIAEMGNTDTDQVKLHFEIRRFGKPVDPVKLLPDRPA